MKNKNKTVLKGLHIALAMLIAVHINAQCPKKKEIKFFGQKFAKHIINGENDKALDFFDPDYRKEQLERNLTGNTKQFLEEFLAASFQKEDFFVPSIENIKKIRVKKVIIDANNAEAKLACKIFLKNRKPYKIDLKVFCKQDNQVYFIGAYG